MPPTLPSFEQRFGLRGAVITAVDLLAGLASFLGWDRLDTPGQSSYHDTDYAAAGRHAADALDDYDLVAVHIEAPDEAAHAADPQTKVAAIEAIDRHVVRAPSSTDSASAPSPSASCSCPTTTRASKPASTTRPPRRF